MKSCDVIDFVLHENAKLHELYIEKQNSCGFDLFGLLSAELEFNIRAGAVKSNIGETLRFAWIYLSMELWDFDDYNI